MIFNYLPIHKLIEELISNLKVSTKGIPEEDRWRLGYNSIELCTRSLTLLDKINISRNEVKLDMIDEIKKNFINLRSNLDELKSKYGYKMTVLYSELDDINKGISEWELLII